MNLAIHPDSVPLRAEPDGSVRIGKTRVLLDLVIHEYHQGASPEMIVQSYSSLAVADVFAVIAYYLNHREEVDQYLRERRQEAEEIRRKHLELFPQDGIRERLMARMKERAEATRDAPAAR